jgi:uncharacterized protein (DUF488 family)
MEKTLYTIGYEGTSPDAFIKTLHKAGVKTVLDVRALPLSRKAGFSKTPLMNLLQKAGIGYVHLRGLGTPKSGRDAAKKGDRAKLRSIFLRHLKCVEAQADLARAIALASKSPSALLCVERKHSICHRSLITPCIIKKTGQEVVNLEVPL